MALPFIKSAPAKPITQHTVLRAEYAISSFSSATAVLSPVFSLSLFPAAEPTEKPITYIAATITIIMRETLNSVLALNKRTDFIILMPPF